MAIQRTVLLIADIGGYTRFMKQHSLALAHAQDAVAKLLEAVIDGARPLKVAKLEGDAAFLYAPVRSDADVEALNTIVTNIRRGFLKRQRDMAENLLCTCKGCAEVDRLNLKFVAHAGEVAFQKVKRFTELAGVDVILVHRMLKNDVPVSEYVLVTDAVRAHLSPALASRATVLEHDFEGLGRTTTHYVDLTTMPEPEPVATRRPWAVRFLERVMLVFRSLPYWTGLKTPCAGFRNLESETRSSLTAGE